MGVKRDLFLAIYGDALFNPGIRKPDFSGFSRTDRLRLGLKFAAPGGLHFPAQQGGRKDLDPSGFRHNVQKRFIDLFGRGAFEDAVAKRKESRLTNLVEVMQNRRAGAFEARRRKPGPNLAAITAPTLGATTTLGGK